VTEQSVPATDPAEDLPEQMRVRRSKRERMLADGVSPYPVTVPKTATLRELREKYAELPTDTATGDRVSVTGRVIFIRNGGKLCFVTLRDGDGTELQAMLSLDKVGEQALTDWKQLVDLGDLVGVTGEVITSRRGELSVLADTWLMSAKALRPLPVAQGGAHPGHRGAQPARVAVPPQFPRGGNTNVAVAARRCDGPPVCDAQQRFGH
jgi:lysyl-tRNA synthetase class 2